MRSLGDANSNRIPDAFEVTTSEAANILADKDQDGVPDIFENESTANPVGQSMKIIVDGKEFNSLESLPPEARARYEEAMGKLDANRNGIPDFVEGMIGTSNQTEVKTTSVPVETPRRSTPLPQSPAIAPDTSNGWMLVLSGLFIFLLCAAGAIGFWYFFLR
jgi:hypothetical protein